MSSHLSPSILVVEDERHIAKFLEFVLQKEGYTVDSVFDGESALRVLQTRRYSAVLLDLGLPGRSGIEVLRDFRSSNDHDTTVVIVLTAKSSSDTLQQILSAGANGHCPKPVAPSTLLRKLKDLGVGEAGLTSIVEIAEPIR